MPDPCHCTTVPAGDADAVELLSEGVPVAVGVAVELVVVLVPRLDLLATGVVGIRVELAQHGRAGNRERKGR